MIHRTCRKPVRTISGIAFASAVLVFAAAHAQDTHPAHPAPDAHAAHAHAAPAPAAVLPAGKHWATDAPLRDGMRRVRESVQALEHAAHGHLNAAQTAEVGDRIDGAVNYMIANCKLDPDADAALHGLLAKFLVGAHAARTGQNLPAALADMQDALKQYPLLFDDPTWNAAAN